MDCVQALMSEFHFLWRLECLNRPQKVFLKNRQKSGLIEKYFQYLHEVDRFQNVISIWEDWRRLIDHNQSHPWITEEVAPGRHFDALFYPWRYSLVDSEGSPLHLRRNKFTNVLDQNSSLLAPCGINSSFSFCKMPPTSQEDLTRLLIIPVLSAKFLSVYVVLRFQKSLLHSPHAVVSPMHQALQWWRYCSALLLDVGKLSLRFSLSALRTSPGDILAQSDDLTKWVTVANRALESTVTVSCALIKMFLWSMVVKKDLT